MQPIACQMLVSCAMLLHSGVFPDYAEKLLQEEKMEKEDSFPQRVWQIVAAIPEGYVTTYGDVAKLAGSPRAARQVGGVLKRLPEGSTLPWHRVVNRHGTISLTGPDLQRQRQALLAEGVMVSGSGQIDLQRYRWNY
ncbi:O6-methylguanine-DNA methyltransferase [Shigella dysenteriae WRSd3]|nr:O6-methylguanine-DNA methyltransferase [Shigella dysenteriae 1617]ESU77917.1 O6-methylguanine-DNA methyltransferase [Shigella dysenteriae WRSd3]ESU83737.1 O6-methylguanine-DNA methyltransferase [Shigella dysenteriae WRSd5]